MPSNTTSILTVIETSPVPNESINQYGADSDEFPEGGTAAWCAVLGGALVQFCGFGYSFGVYQAFYTLHYLTNESPSVISWIGSVNAFLASVIGLIAGRLYDRGYFYHLLVGGALLQSFSLFMLSLAQQGQYYQIFLTQGVAFGLAQGIMYIPSVAVVSHYFNRRRTLAMSLVTSGSSLGSIVHPIMLNYLFNQGIGFANGVRISSTLVSILLLVACLLIRTRLEPPKRSVKYLSIGRGIINDLPFCFMGFGLLTFQTSFYYLVFYLQLDSVQHRNSSIFSFYVSAIFSGASFIGRLLTGFFASHIGVPMAMIISTAACGVLIFGMIGMSSVQSVVVFSVLGGFFTGTCIALMSPLIAFLTDDSSELGARMGVGILAAGIGALIGGPISGALLTSRYKWWRASLFDGLAALLGCWFLIMMEFARRRKCLLKSRQEKNEIYGQ